MVKSSKSSKPSAKKAKATPESAEPVAPKRTGRPPTWTEETTTKLGEDLVEWMEADEKNIFFAEFCLKWGIYKQRVSEMTKKFPVFAEHVKRAEAIQEVRLNKIALLTGKPIGAIFLLKAKHGYTEKLEVKTDNINRNYDTKDLAAATDEQLRDILRAVTDSKGDA